MQAVLLLLVLLLTPEAGAEEIIDGVESKPHSRPYMAHLEITTERGYTASCGGFLITPKYVLTAAHCKGREITVTLGAHDVTKDEPTQQKLKVQEQIVHPDYNFYTSLNDIMLLKLQRRVKLTPAVGPVPPAHPIKFSSTWKNVPGSWLGKTGVTEPTSDTLREVKQRIMSKEDCKHYLFYDYSFQVCVGSPRKARSAFKGDSGDP